MNGLVQGFLNILEQCEARFLSWGFVDGGFTEDEVYELAAEYLENADSNNAAGIDADQLIQEMQDRRLLFDLNLGGLRLWRTRMAESIRLFARLRQIFPNKRWQLAPTLVADFRFLQRERTYPRRHLPPAEVLSSLGNFSLAQEKRNMLSALLDAPDRGPVLLSGFQMRALSRMLSDLQSHRDRGMIVCAGTGTGKTLAFYLPSLIHVGSLITAGAYWTKGVAIYPRNELLKDQFSETYVEARRLDAVMLRQAGRKMIIGAFFGPTPKYASVESVKEQWKEKFAGGYVCPYLRCPHCDNGLLVWREEDITSQIERLHCAQQGCGFVSGADELILTRNKMKFTPPDMLFTTTEMLNRNMADSRFRHVFGVKALNRPQVALLDEVHTYEGVHGAQVAHLLRRWKHAVGGRLHFTGLSATLEDAANFFADLVGLQPYYIEEIRPFSEEMIQEGMEYLLALRGDPVSATSLLSTTIQASMLLGRIMDPLEPSFSQGMYGYKAFLFTDDLDVTNRLYHNLLDAEGLNSWGRPLPDRQPLAALRSTNLPENANRMTEGQSWQLCEEIGHAQNLNVPLRIGRTSSQDTGVDRDSNLVVATASLEVGYNDPRVGAVVQHKAPRGMASFLQRMGRAGRKREMRPWTVVVLSDYGRDRIAYQGYDLLFNPVLEKRSLPVANHYVLRMQAVFAFMDWMGEQLGNIQPKGSIWNDFSQPASNKNSNSAFNKYRSDMEKRQEDEAAIIKKVLENPQTRADLAAYLEKALQIDKKTVQALLWEYPRPLIIEVLPTLLRRLENKWIRVTSSREDGGLDCLPPYNPLPEYVPANLFSDLNLPEVSIIIEVGADREEGQLMPIIQALKTFAPGKVTRRFGIRRANESHWIAPTDLESPRQTIALESFCPEYDDLGMFQYHDETGKTKEVRCVRPSALLPVSPPAQVLTTTNAQLIWQTQIFPQGDGTPFETPRGLSWQQIIREISFYTHSQQASAMVRRFARNSKSSLRMKKGPERELLIGINRSETEERVAVGFAQEVDGIAFRFVIPEGICVDHNDPNREMIRSFRTAYFRHRVFNEDRLEGLANVFQRDWLCQIYLSALVAAAMSNNIILAEAHDIMTGATLEADLATVLDAIFQIIEEENETTEDVTEEEKGTIRQKVHQKLLDLFADPTVSSVLHNLAPVLWEDPDAGWNAWAVQRFKATLGSALLQACYHVCAKFEVGELFLDIDPGPRPPHLEAETDHLAELWITEGSSGGGGMIEEVQRRFAEDPRQFFHIAESALEASDFELVDVELTRVLDMLQNDQALQDIFASMRSVQGYEQLREADKCLRNALSARGIMLSHPVVSALNTRILRAGSSPQSDILLRTMLERWRGEEARLGIEIDARVFAYLAAGDPLLEDAVAHVDPGTRNNLNWRFQVLYGLLWPRGNTVRSRNLTTYNPFTTLPPADRDILNSMLGTDQQTVRLNSDDWLEKLTSALEKDGAVRLVAPAEEKEELKSALLRLASTPLDIGFLHLYPRLTGLRRNNADLCAILEIKEAVQ